MTWEILWALILGFALSAAVQAVVSQQQMRRLLPDHSPSTLVVAAGLGAASSSCSYAAVALARSLFRKGADFTAAMTFQFASTNLVDRLPGPRGRARRALLPQGRRPLDAARDEPADELGQDRLAEERGDRLKLLETSMPTSATRDSRCPALQMGGDRADGDGPASDSTTRSLIPGSSAPTDRGRCLVEPDQGDVSAGAVVVPAFPAAVSPATGCGFPPCTASHERAISSRVANQTPSNPFA